MCRGTVMSVCTAANWAEQRFVHLTSRAKKESFDLRISQVTGKNMRIPHLGLSVALADFIDDSSAGRGRRGAKGCPEGIGADDFLLSAIERVLRVLATDHHVIIIPLSSST
uniref:Uncharacterized protein n=1 Tax=Lotharella globosa TaxID=91324 RepID=A0A7S4DHI3_9EUKA